MTIPHGTYVLTNVKALVALDLSEGDGQSIIAFSPHGGPNQQWEFQDAGNGLYHLRNVGLNKYLTFPDEANDGKQVIATDGPREWEVRVGHEGDDERESIRIFVPGTEQNLDLKDFGDETAGNIVQLWSRTRGKHQAWYFESGKPPRLKCDSKAETNVQ
ncbi:ricin B-like lectin [Ceratobasidium sp. AG-I]|nr:ricin B-like lectin [Ceratobasidium sp. AG-I]